MEVNQELIDYIKSEQFMLDTMLHAEGGKLVYLEPIPANKNKEMFWLNGRLMNCKHWVKHTGTYQQITDLIAKKFNITKVDIEETSKRGDGGLTVTKEYATLMIRIGDSPKVIESPRFIYKNEAKI